MQPPDLLHVPEDILLQLANMRPYTLGILKKGPNFASEEGQRIVQAEHLPYLFQLRKEGKVLLSMPIMDETDYAAIAVYAVTEKDEVHRLMESDPGVRQGVFVYELFASIGMKGDALT